MKGIKNILFDLGGVLINLDRQRAVRAFEQLGFENINDFLGDYGQKGPFLALEEGRIGLDEFYDTIRQYIPQASNQEIFDAFMEFLVDLPVAKLQMITRLREQGYQILMLSNTNELMFGPIREVFFKQEPGKDINSYFDHLFLSHEMGMVKPNPAIYKQILTEAQIKAEETLFIDDSQKNLDAAAKLGFQTYLAAQYSDFSHIFH